MVSFNVFRKGAIHEDIHEDNNECFEKVVFRTEFELSVYTSEKCVNNKSLGKYPK